MATSNVENRLTELESQVAGMQEELSALHRPGKDWKRTIGAFTDNDGMQGLLNDAMKLRDDDREGTRPEDNGSDGSD